MYNFCIMYKKNYDDQTKDCDVKFRYACLLFAIYCVTVTLELIF